MADRAGDEREDLVAKRERWRTLPARIPRSELIEEQASEPPPDPDGGRDPERDFMLRNAGF